MKVVYWAWVRLARQTLTEQLGAVPGVQLTVVEVLDELLRVLPDTEGLVLFDPRPGAARRIAEVLQLPGQRLRWIHILSAGRENIEEAGLPASVVVTQHPGAVAPAVAEHALALLLALGRCIPQTLAAQATGRWDRSMVPVARTLEGATVAIVGYGQIGQELARRMQGFATKLVGVSRTPGQDSLLSEWRPFDQLDAVLAEADAVVLTLALTPQTRHLVNARSLACMKRGALLVNVARGGVVDQIALVEALRSGQLGGAGLDVTDPEPLTEGDPMWQAPNLIVSPHYAGAGSPPSVARIVDGAVRNLRAAVAQAR